MAKIFENLGSLHQVLTYMVPQNCKHFCGEPLQHCKRLKIIASHYEPRCLASDDAPMRTGEKDVTLHQHHTIIIISFIFTVFIIIIIIIIQLGRNPCLFVCNSFVDGVFDVSLLVSFCTKFCLVLA